jgi:hypothetical protein
MIGGDLTLAPQDHGTERKRLAQNPGEVGSNKAVLFEQVLEETEGAELWRLDGFFFPLFDQVAEQIEVVVLILGHLILESREHIGDLHGALIAHLAMNRAGRNTRQSSV